LLDNLYERTALRIGKDPTLSTGLAIEQAVRAAGIEPDDPIANNLQRHTDDLGSLASAALVVNLGQRQQPPSLVGALRQSSQPTKRRPIEIIPQANR
jgi:hypothetical protein